MKRIETNKFNFLILGLGITQYKFGQVIGINGRTIPKYLNNPKLLSVLHLERLAEYEPIKDKGLNIHDLIELILQETL